MILIYSFNSFSTNSYILPSSPAQSQTSTASPRSNCRRRGSEGRNNRQQSFPLNQQATHGLGRLEVGQHLVAREQSKSPRLQGYSCCQASCRKPNAAGPNMPKRSVQKSVAAESRARPPGICRVCCARQPRPRLCPRRRPDHRICGHLGGAPSDQCTPGQLVKKYTLEIEAALAELP